ncbi:MAG: CAP domain-containing protein [Acidobacteriota bacterium]
MAVSPYSPCVRHLTPQFTKLLLLALATGLLGLPAGVAQADELADVGRQSLKLDLVQRINRDRARAGLPPVLFDPQSSEVADRYCDEQIRNRTTGHFTLDGLSPYMRYSFAGGNDGLSQNTAAWSANYRFSPAMIPDLISQSQRTMLAELPPNDGHRRTILDPFATHVGVGLAWERGEFRMTEEFIRRYVNWSRPLARTATGSDQLVAEGQPVAGFQTEAISVYFENNPQPLSAVTANGRDSYGLPPGRRDFLPAPVSRRNERLLDGRAYVRPGSVTDVQARTFPVSQDGRFLFQVPLDQGAGVYTIVVWVKKNGGSTPIAASNVSIRVDSSLQPLVAAGGR